jgi:hypothetical protein
MGKRHGRNDMRSRIAHLAAQFMAEDGIEDYAHAKRKAARQIGLSETRELPSNDEIDAALRVHLTLYQRHEHDARVRHLRERALDAMREFARFNPHLTGSVLSGNAGRYADIDLHLFTDNPKAVEHFLLERQIPYRTTQNRLYSGDSPVAAPLFTISDGAVDLHLTVLPGQALRLPLRSSPAGKPMERAKAEAVRLLVAQSAGAATAGCSEVPRPSD